ncbi:MAG: FAD-dependent monooxygenase, partial [Halobacteriaceae archaeon]
MHVYEPNGTELCFIDHGSLADSYGTLYSIDRAHLHRFLRGTMGGFDIKMGTTIDTLHQADDAVTVTFDDGERDVYDLVVGADGLNSRVRNLVF